MKPVTWGVFDDAMDAHLREMFADDGFQAILAELGGDDFRVRRSAVETKIYPSRAPGATSPRCRPSWTLHLGDFRSARWIRAFNTCTHVSQKRSRT